MKLSDNRHTILIILAFALLLFGCKNDPYKDSNVRINGSFPLLAGKKMYLNEIEIYGYAPLDTFEIDRDGNMIGGLNVAETGIYILKSDNQNFINLILEPGEEITIGSESSEIKANYTVEGSPGSKKILAFEKQYEEKRSIIEEETQRRGLSAGQMNLSRKYSGVKALFDSLLLEHKNYVIEQIKAEPASIANLVMINRRFAQSKVFNEFDDFDILSLLDSALMEKYPGNKHVKEHHSKMEKAYMRLQAEERAKERLAEGKPAPDITMTGLDGKELTLSEIDGKYTLLYFWSSSDAASRRASPVLVDLHQKYKNKGLKIFGVSLDVYEEMWKGAIKADNLNWFHASDLTGRHSPAVFLYQVPGQLPYFYLLDKDKKIITSSGDINTIADAAESAFKP
jgi:peroxiredoxin